MSTVTGIEGMVILNSCGMPALEVSVELVDGFRGSASSATPLARAGRESASTILNEPLGAAPASVGRVVASLLGESVRQEDFDEKLARTGCGGDLSIALSLAFARASAAAAGKPLLSALLTQYGGRPALPQPLINVMSGGIHAPDGALPLQQLMIFPAGEPRSVVACLNEGVELFGGMETELMAKGHLLGYSASSGMLTPFSAEEALDYLCAYLARHAGDRWRVGVDFAAEHVGSGAGLRHYVAADWAGWVEKLRATYPIWYFEDPFRSGDTAEWRAFKRAVTPETLVVGDDLFVSRTEWLAVSGELANTVLLKLNQAGTVSALFAAARRATAHGLVLCTSHRSCETEDTALVEISVALGARLMKLGGPRRGDRVSRYNQLLRLARLVGD